MITDKFVLFHIACVCIINRKKLGILNENIINETLQHTLEVRSKLLDSFLTVNTRLENNTSSSWFYL